MATCIWEAMQMKASGSAAYREWQRRDRKRDRRYRAWHLYDDGPARRRDARCAFENVTVQLGDSALPDAPVEGGSFTTSSVGSAICAACLAVQEELLGLAQNMAGRASPARRSMMWCLPKAGSGKDGQSKKSR